jgi:glutamine cyclotransferase
MNRFFRIFFINNLILLGVFCIGYCSNLGSSININVIPVYTYQVFNTYPHDQSAFTEGLVFEDGVLYEGTGLYECSSLRRVELKTGKVLQIRELQSQYFGEGITIYKNKIIQLTWKSNLGFVYDKYSFKLLQEFNYPNEGWGITYDGNCLIMSDGTSTLHFLDPETFEEISQIEVYENGIPVTKINELEYVQGEIFANIWLTERIARIDPMTGQVTGWIDLKGILSPEDCSEKVDVLNGIAYNAKNNRFLVTGKFWPKLFEIELIKEEMGVNLLLREEVYYDKAKKASSIRVMY